MNYLFKSERLGFRNWVDSDISLMTDISGDAEVMKYFIPRPKESQIAAWVSKQSSKISARQALESKYAEMKAKFSKGEVPLPKFWGGYIVKPSSIEFWQGGEKRLHDRFLYTKEAARWDICRLAP